MADLYAAAAETAGPALRSKRSRYEMMRGAYWSERSSFDSHWQELSAFLQPRRSRFWPGDRNRGDKRNQNIIDSTGRFTIRTLASGMHAGLTSPARPWMKLTTPDPDLAKLENVKEWLSDTTQRILTVFAQGNLYNALPIVYGDIGLFGTAAMSILEDTRDLFRAYAYPIGSYALGLDDRGVVTTFIREYEMTVRSAVQSFGGKMGEAIPIGAPIQWSNFSTRVKNQWDRGNYEAAVQVAWIVIPNEQADERRFGAKYLPWSSCHWERGSSNNPATVDDGGGFLRESGFRTFPILAPRWEVTSPEDSYGTACPGMDMLGDVKQLQIMQRRKGQAISKMIDPPVSGPSSLRTQDVSLLPGKITYVDVREGQQGLKSVHDVRIDLSHLTADIAQTQYRIQRAGYEDLFLMLANSDPARGMQPITAREVDERHEEKLLALGPVLERTNDELLDPLVDRVYAMMDAHGLISPPPPELHGVSLKVEYISILAQAQKLVGVVGQDRFLQSTLPLMQTDPTIRHKIRWFKVVDNYGDMLGVDPRIVVPDDEAQAAVNAEQQAHQAAADAINAKTMAQAAATAGAKPVAPDSPLDRVLGGGGAASAAVGGPA
jgi:hypothetical protein